MLHLQGLCHIVYFEMRNFATFGPTILMAFLLVSIGCRAQAESLIALKDGQKAMAEDLLQQGSILVYLEKDCVPCLKYARDLQECEAAIRAKIVFVSVSTPAQTKALARQLPKEFPLYVLNERQRPSFLKATPTTRTMDLKLIGPLECSRFASSPSEKESSPSDTK